jgi:hypothetical protein
MTQAEIGVAVAEPEAQEQAGAPTSSTGQHIGRAEVLEVVQRWLHINDLEAIDIIMAVALAIFMLGDPLWLYVVAPPGGSKTELLRSLLGPRVVTISTLTPQTLISGLKGAGEKTDLLPQLDGKLLVVKDFTSILSKKSEDATAIFADLREAYDGYLEKSFGSGVGIKGYHARFGILAGVTPAIDMYRNVHALLGERFLRVNLMGQERGAVERASELEGDEATMREELSRVVGGFLVSISEWVDDGVVVEQRQLEQLRSLARVTAALRTPVARDRRHAVLYPPEREIGTRLVKQLMRLSKALAIFRARFLVNAEDYIAARRVALDCVPKNRLSALAVLLSADGWLTTKAVGDAANQATETAREVLEDMWLLRLIDRSGDSQFQWAVRDETRELLAGACIDLGTQTTPSTREEEGDKCTS